VIAFSRDLHFYLSATFGSVSEGQQPGRQMQRQQALLLVVAL
jgi:hypothetical protein